MKLFITPTWHKPGYHLHTFTNKGTWRSAEFYPTKKKVEQAFVDKANELRN